MKVEMKKTATALLWVLLLLDHAEAAEVSLAAAQNLAPTNKLRFEGEIVPGDAAKLRSAALKYGPSIHTVYLNSKGGDVLEAMKIGRLIRRLRLNTETGFYDSATKVRWCVIKLANDDNCICASACFLAFSAGAWRFGHNLALHRPFLPKPAAATLSDIRLEEAQKAAMLSVRKYLEEMEVPSFYIDTMMARNSQDAYLVTDDAVNQPLNGYPPSIEEITLTKCKDITDEQFGIIGSLARKGDRRTPQETNLMNDLQVRLDAGMSCKNDVLKQLRIDAFKREVGGDDR